MCISYKIKMKKDCEYNLCYFLSFLKISRCNVDHIDRCEKGDMHGLRIRDLPFLDS